MLFLTASSIGLLAGMTRSAMLVAIVAFLIVGTFAAASLLGAGPVHILNLLAAILGYNFGLFALIAGMALFQRPRSA